MKTELIKLEILELANKVKLKLESCNFKKYDIHYTITEEMITFWRKDIKIISIEDYILINTPELIKYLLDRLEDK